MAHHPRNPDAAMTRFDLILIQTWIWFGIGLAAWCLI